MLSITTKVLPVSFNGDSGTDGHGAGSTSSGSTNAPQSSPSPSNAPLASLPFVLLPPNASFFSTRAPATATPATTNAIAPVVVSRRRTEAVVVLFRVSCAAVASSVVGKASVTGSAGEGSSFPCASGALAGLPAET